MFGGSNEAWQDLEACFKGVNFRTDAWNKFMKLFHAISIL